MAPTIISVVYPSGCKFNMDYYLSHHMPLVQSKWASFGLTSWKVAQYTDADSPYSVIAWLEFSGPEGSEQWAKATSSEEAKEIFGDIPHFTDAKPDLFTGAVVKSASW